MCLKRKLITFILKVRKFQLLTVYSFSTAERKHGDSASLSCLIGLSTANPSKLNKIYFLILRLFFLKQETFFAFLRKIILIRKYSEK